METLIRVFKILNTMTKTTNKLKSEADEQATLYDMAVQDGELKEYRIFGSPGCGKTTMLGKQVTNAVAKFGSDKVILASFTKTAAAELNSRGMPIPKQNIATLHAHAYRSLGRPALLDVGKFNNYIKQYNPDWMLSLRMAESSIEEPDMPSGRTEGDKMHSEYDLLRAKMMPSSMNNTTNEFIKHYENFKRETETIDFTDMISMALENVETMPNKPDVGFFDETQDFTPLELSLVRKWGKNMKFIVLAGDDDQTLFTFKGATPDAFLNPKLPDDRIKILPRSYRVPKAIHQLALEYVETLSHRQYKEYLPRFEVKDYDIVNKRRIYDENHIANGEVTREAYSMNSGVSQMISQAVDNEKANETSMILTACSYQLENLKSALKRNGILFHNPFRLTNGGWNPLGKDTIIKRIDAYEKYAQRERDTGDAFWTVGEFLLWSDMVSTSATFQRGVISQLKKLDENAELSSDDIHHAFNKSESLEATASGNLNWLKNNLTKQYESRYYYIQQIFNRYGRDYLSSGGKPMITIGTIHSVKGGEADHVFLAPDLSPQGYQDYMRSSDNAIRQMYVGMTRAFKHLHILEPCGNTGVDF